MSAPASPGGPDPFTQHVLRRLTIPAHEKRFWDDLQRALASVPGPRPDRTQERPLPGVAVPGDARDDARALVPLAMRQRGNLVIVALVVLALVVVLAAVRLLGAERSAGAGPSVTIPAATTPVGPARIVPGEARLGVAFTPQPGEIRSAGVAAFLA